MGIISISPILVDNGDVNKFLTILYKGEQLDSLAVTNMYIRNMGKLALRGSDIAEPIRIFMKNDIVDVLIINTNNKDLRISTDIDTKRGLNYVKVEMENLFRDDYIYLSIIHTGSTSEQLLVEAEFIDIEFKEYKSKSEVLPLIITGTIGFITTEVLYIVMEKSFKAIPFFTAMYGVMISYLYIIFNKYFKWRKKIINIQKDEKTKNYLRDIGIP